MGNMGYHETKAAEFKIIGFNFHHSKETCSTTYEVVILSYYTMRELHSCMTHLKVVEVAHPNYRFLQVL